MLESLQANEVECLRDLAQRLAGAVHGEAGILVAQTAQLLNCSAQTIYRRLEKLGWDSGRKQRADKGTLWLSRDEAAVISGLLMASRRANGKRLLSIEAALDIARNECLIRGQRIDKSSGEVLQLSPSAVSDALYHYGLHPQQLDRPTPHAVLRSLHPNHVWQLDASICVLFYLRTGGLAIMEKELFYKNKPANFAKIANDRVIRNTLTDHTSDWGFVLYTLGSEDTAAAVETLLAAIQYRGEKDPVYGVPLLLYVDQGSPYKSGMFRNLCRRLMIRQIFHSPRNARATGSVENMQNLVECGFESRLGIGIRVEALDELNAKAAIWMQWFNSTKVHSRHGLTRYGCWLRIKQEQLRIPPPLDVCRALVTTYPESRVVSGALTISYAVPGFGSQTYKVDHVPGVRVGDSVMVCVNPYKAPSIVIEEENAEGESVFYEAAPVLLDLNGYPLDAPVIGENYKSPGDTQTDRNRKEVEKLAYGVATQDELKAKRAAKAQAFPDIDPIGYLADQTPASFVERRGVDLPITAPRVEALPLSHTQMAMALARLLPGEWNADWYAQMTRLYPNGVTEDALPAVAERLKTGSRLVAIAGGA